MQRSQQSHALPLFGAQSQALSKLITNRGLAASLIGAFFTILAVGLILGGATKVLGTTPSFSVATTVHDERAAFIPGQFVTNVINQGYIGN